MKWTNPVTNKTNENYMNVSDFKRIAGNIEYTYFGLSVGASVPTPDTVAPFVEKFNALAADSLIYKDEFSYQVLSALAGIVAQAFNAGTPRTGLCGRVYRGMCE